MFRCGTFIRQAILNSQDCFIHIIYFDSFTVTIWIPDCYLFLIELLLVCFIIELLKYIVPKSITN